MGLTTTDTHAV